MVKSMTGYGRAQSRLCNKRDITVEVRSVNNRYPGLHGENAP